MPAPRLGEAFDIARFGEESGVDKDEDELTELERHHHGSSVAANVFDR